MLSQEKFYFTCGDSMKGQFFLISGAIVIVVLFLIKSSLNLSQIIEKKLSLETSMEREEFLNIKNGLIKTVEYSYNKNESEKIENFLKYVKKRLEARTLELEGIAIEASYRNVTAGYNISLNVTVFNFLGENISSLNLTFSYDGSSQIFSNIADGMSVNTDFVFNTSSNVNYTLSVNFTTSKENKFHNITIPVEMEKSKFISFFSLIMVGWGTENRDEFSKVVEIV